MWQKMSNKKELPVGFEPNILHVADILTLNHPIKLSIDQYLLEFQIQGFKLR